MPLQSVSGILSSTQNAQCCALLKLTVNIWTTLNTCITFIYRLYNVSVSHFMIATFFYLFFIILLYLTNERKSNSNPHNLVTYPFLIINFTWVTQMYKYVITSTGHMKLCIIFIINDSKVNDKLTIIYLLSYNIDWFGSRWHRIDAAERTIETTGHASRTALWFRTKVTQ